MLMNKDSNRKTYFYVKKQNQNKTLNQSKSALSQYLKYNTTKYVYTHTHIYIYIYIIYMYIYIYIYIMCVCV